MSQVERQLLMEEQKALASVSQMTQCHSEDKLSTIRLRRQLEGRQWAAIEMGTETFK